MTLAIHGLVVSRGIAIGRAVLAASSHLDVSHYYITPEQVGSCLLYTSPSPRD